MKMKPGLTPETLSEINKNLWQY